MPKSKQNCSVFKCSSVRRKNPNLSFHQFPKDGQKIRLKDEFGNAEIVDRRKLWCIKLKMGKKVSKYMQVCSAHFTEEDFECSGWSTKKRLKSTAVPSQHLPCSSHNAKNFKEELANARGIRRLKRRKLHEPTPVIDFSNNVAAESVMSEESAAEALLTLSLAHSDVQLDVHPVEEPISCTHNIVQPQVQHHLTTYRNVGIQVDTNDLINHKDCAVQVDTRDLVTISDFAKTDKHLNTLTGLATFLHLNVLVQLLGSVKSDKRVHRLTLYKRVFLVFMKLKLDLPYSVLAVLFGVSGQTCKKIFFENVTSLAQILSNAIQFPSVSEIKKNLPKCFRDFKNVRIVLDCTEISIQRHQQLCCRIKCYSHYKGTTTIKFMTGVSPAGLITYVSSPYGGRVSDTAIFKQSNLLRRLSPGEAVMVDKGFLIEGLCKEFGIVLIRPPFLKQKKQFSHDEAIENAKIACARVHIERSNQRIKIFSILNNRLPITLLPIIGDIFIVICGVVNLSNPILSENKFLKE